MSTFTHLSPTFGVLGLTGIHYGLDGFRDRVAVHITQIVATSVSFRFANVPDMLRPRPFTPIVATRIRLLAPDDPPVAFLRPMRGQTCLIATLCGAERDLLIKSLLFPCADAN